MEELSLHILDIVENSIRAGARNVTIRVDEDLESDRLTIVIRDDGEGMDPTTQQRVFDPFFTTKEGKRVGLGLPLLVDAARQADGDFHLRSERGGGTEIVATFRHSHIDRQPLGDMSETLETLIVGHPAVEFVYIHRCRPRATTAGGGRRTETRVDTREIKQALGAVPLCSGDGIRRVRAFLKTRQRAVAGG